MKSLLQVMAEDLCLDAGFVAKVVDHSASFYRTYYIDKRGGGKRRIDHPGSELKTLQYWVVDNILRHLPVSPWAYAYRKGVSIQDHARLHARKRFILHLDITDFFVHITKAHIGQIIEKNRSLSQLEEFFAPTDPAEEQQCAHNLLVLRQICLLKGRLTIGAVSSPMVSNAALFQFDTTAHRYCEERSLLYSRYADDLYISSDSHIDYAVVEDFEKMLRTDGFQLNRIKTKFMSRKGRQVVTGLTVTPDNKVTVGLKMRSQIKEMVYKKLTTGEGDSQRILGYLSYLRQIEPHTFNRVLIKYAAHGDIIDLLTKKK